jgi:hypothetical protein
VPFRDIVDWYKQYGMEPLDGYDQPEVRALLGAHSSGPGKRGRTIGIAIGSLLGVAVLITIAYFPRRRWGWGGWGGWWTNLRRITHREIPNPATPPLETAESRGTAELNGDAEQNPTELHGNATAVELNEGAGL